MKKVLALLYLNCPLTLVGSDVQECHPGRDVELRNPGISSSRVYTGKKKYVYDHLILFILIMLASRV